jgi:hypothetical protein
MQRIVRKQHDLLFFFLKKKPITPILLEIMGRLS